MGAAKSRTRRDRVESASDLARARVPDHAEIATIVDSVITTLSGGVTAEDVRLRDELAALSGYIQRARDEISALHPGDIKSEHIPRATDELYAIIEATEEATSTILDCAEQLEALGGRLDEDPAKEIEATVTRIYEACNFQDITGQRINKVIKTLRHIEDRVNAMLAALGGEHCDSPEFGEPINETPANEVDDSALLNGPQRPDDAISQDDIDALLAD